MDHAIAQLKKVRLYSRTILLTRPWIVVACGFVVALMIGGVLDYALRMPAWFRVAVIALAAAAAARWLFRQLREAAGYQPSLGTLALRAERLHPELRGWFASGVEFVLGARRATPDGPTTASRMQEHSINTAGVKVQQIDLATLLRTNTLRPVLLALGVVVVVAAGVVNAAPDISRLAVMRWFAPWGDAQWPRKVQLASGMRATGWPVDTPILFRASVLRGYYPGIRVWLHYQVTDPSGGARPWRSLLMSEQSDPSQPSGDKSTEFERLVLIDQATTAATQGPRRSVRYYFSAYDDQTQEQTLALLTRPDVALVRVHVIPPPYANALIDPFEVQDDAPLNTTTSIEALSGSELQVTVMFNKPIGVPARGIGRFAPGFNAESGVALEPILDGGETAKATGLRGTIRLIDSIETPINLVDEHGVQSTADRHLRIDALPDRQPSVVLTKPESDLQVLPTAVVALQAVAQDDIGLEWLRIESSTHSDDTPGGTPLPRHPGVAERLSASGELDLRDLALAVGETFTLQAAAQDVFEWGGQRHPIERSSARTVTVIDPATLIMKLQSRMAAMRRQVQQTRQRQAHLIDGESPNTPAAQRSIGDRVKAMSGTVSDVAQQMAMNRLDAPAIQTLVNDADALLRAAEQQSDAARKELSAGRTQTDAPDEAEQEAQQKTLTHQQEVHDALAQLENLLDQGREVLAQEAQLNKLLEAQRALIDRTRAMVPEMLGRPFQELTDVQKNALRAAADTQMTLSEQAAKLAQRMRVTARALADQSTSLSERASAQALLEAATIAQRQALAQDMSGASESVAENKLAAATSQQRSAMKTMREMHDALTSVEKHRQAILRRRVEQLVEQVAQLLRQQEHQIDRLERTQGNIDALQVGQESLRRNTMVVAESAKEAEQTRPVSEQLDEAASDQRQAVGGLRADDKDTALTSENDAKAHLEHALRLVRGIEQEMLDRQREDDEHELRQQYEQLARNQDAIRKDALSILRQGPPTRRLRPQILRVAADQEKLTTGLKELRERVGGTVVFLHLHDRIESESAAVARSIRTAGLSEDGTDQQGRIAALLRRIADALEPPQADDNFTGGSGAGGGGSGGGGPQEPIPPLGELVLLREMQGDILTRTRAVHERAAGDGQPEERDRLLGELTADQRLVADLAEQLQEKMDLQDVDKSDDNDKQR